MTIAVVWQEDGLQWCAADTRLVGGSEDRPITELGSKIFSISVATRAMNPDGLTRRPHFLTQYGFVYAGSALPAAMTAITASTLLQTLAQPGGQSSPPKFEEVAHLVQRLAKRFMSERRQLGGDGLFSAGFFGWCPYDSKFKLAHIDGRADFGSFRVELNYPKPPADGEPWLVLGAAESAFNSTLESYETSEHHITKRIPRRVIQRMVAQGSDPTVGGATSIGIAHEFGFDLFYGVEPIVHGQPEARRIFNGLDLDLDVGEVGHYLVAINGMA